MVDIGEQLRYFRQRKKMNQKQLAELLHVTPQTISKWELNKSAPDYDQLIALSKIYRKSIDALLGQAKPSLLDYLADSQNFRNQYGVSSTNGGEDDGRKDS
ncbi:helix-turn-helix domain-containing protein [Enterococcus raffinosus]|uniref:Helix-turn-helix transcriptional regulator n=1 Tax=Enterococcus raffinosus TaxID=71452 RepID=A0AAW8T886_9ENTE|nr:helix-turn-helix transcriptional regulator [Enterococcus raffinosus]MDT2522230.1 helix-turn-helix transcriptional regulator [Enterococcus raffinosus]MDT2529736.1 helix-turn-helix transcriptional regulator [Enterococcus raffinosus]MDT2533417.1 helix-turn-helix transcriptional regulator [Enterococcus raffinosus]MDT2543307.1 helix-turn-helix transcriptional regulator [Enterococcus raffinosus]MDT2554229.1 helix-turn-helix transcriptional regulator [Enterococcus raffinosus]